MKIKTRQLPVLAAAFAVSATAMACSAGEGWSDSVDVTRAFEDAAGRVCDDVDGSTAYDLDPYGGSITTCLPLDVSVYVPEHLSVEELYEAHLEGMERSTRHMADLMTGAQQHQEESGNYGVEFETSPHFTYVGLLGDGWYLQARRSDMLDADGHPHSLNFESAVDALEAFQAEYGGELRIFDSREEEAAQAASEPAEPGSSDPSAGEAQDDPAEASSPLTSGDLEVMLAAAADSGWACSNPSVYPVDEGPLVTPPGTEMAVCESDLQLLKLAGPDAADEYRETLRSIVEDDPQVEQVVLSAVGADWAFTVWLNDNTLTTPVEFDVIRYEVDELRALGDVVGAHEIVAYPERIWDEVPR